MNESNLHISSFLSERAQELDLLPIGDKEKKRTWNQSYKKCLRTTVVSGQPFDFGPKRRTSSYRPYKVPHRIKARKVENSSKIESQKCLRPRKHRRRIRWLMEQHRCFSNRYQSNGEDDNNVKEGWLETHTWHRKRMHMSAEWGIQQAEYSRAKGMTKKLIDGLANNGCLLHDSSYVKPVELKGDSFAALERVIRRVISPGSDLYFIDYKKSTNGASSSDEESLNDNSIQDVPELCSPRETNILMYNCDAFPEGCVGPATLMAIPPIEAKEVETKECTFDVVARLWVWLHPAMLDIAYQQLKRAIEGETVTLEYVLDPPCRFSVRGSGSFDTVTSSLLAPKDTCVDGNSSLLRELAFISQRIQNAVWKEGGMLSIQARDYSGHARPKVQSNANAIGIDNSQKDGGGKPRKRGRKKRKLIWPCASTAASSELWSAEGRSIIRHNTVSIHSINANRQQRRQKMYSLTCSSNIKQDKIVPYIPIVLIRKNESCTHGESVSLQQDSLGQGSLKLNGFDVLVPASLASRVWTTLCLGNKVDAVRRAIGYRELAFVYSAAGLQVFPQDYPDTPAGEYFWKKKLYQAHDRDTKRPAGKRSQNLWGVLPQFSLDILKGREKKFVVPRHKQFNELFHRPKCNTNAYPPLLVLPQRTALCVLLIPLSKGVPSVGAMILCPQKNDVMQWLASETRRKKGRIFLESGKIDDAWQGVQLESKEKGFGLRKAMGIVTSGRVKAIRGADRSAVGPTDTRCGTGLCEAELVQVAQQLSHECGSARSRSLVMFCNETQSGWLRPALLHINSLGF